jgi:hypothetical protein
MMNEATLAQELAFVVAQRQQDETTVLARAVREGVRVLYHETLVEAYLASRISRQDALKQLGPEMLEEIEYQRDALQRDVAWGLGDE